MFVACDTGSSFKSHMAPLDYYGGMSSKLEALCQGPQLEMKTLCHTGQYSFAPPPHPTLISSGKTVNPVPLLVQHPNIPELPPFRSCGPVHIYRKSIHDENWYSTMTFEFKYVNMPAITFFQLDIGFTEHHFSLGTFMARRPCIEPRQ